MDVFGENKNYLPLPDFETLTPNYLVCSLVTISNAILIDISPHKTA